MSKSCHKSLCARAINLQKKLDLLLWAGRGEEDREVRLLRRFLNALTRGYRRLKT